MPEAAAPLLTYCANIHPGESWDEAFRALRTHVPAITAALGWPEPFPLGLRLSARAAREVDAPAAQAFLEWCAAHDCFAATVNGFPYGPFHGPAVKGAVYAPDWARPERAAYTRRLADLLDRWLPPGVRGSISTVPLLGPEAALEPGAREAAAGHLRGVLEHLARLRERSGKHILLALEPEPGCALESTEDVVAFFARLRLPGALREGLGLCYDCCHHAVRFEDPARSIRALADAGIPIPKVQVSSALAVSGESAELLRPLDEPRYLHQTFVRDPGGGVRGFADLGAALELGAREGEWRVHFHVPVFAEGYGPLGTTRAFLEQALPLFPPTALFEVETYTWEVLPASWRTDSVAAAVARELAWVRERLDATHRGP